MCSFTYVIQVPVTCFHYLTETALRCETLTLIYLNVLTKYEVAQLRSVQG